MGERGVLRDILIILLTLIVAVELFLVVRQNDRIESRLKEANTQGEVLRDILAELKKGGGRVVTGPQTTPNTSDPVQQVKTTVADGIPDRSEWEKQYIDPKAEAGGTIYRSAQVDPGTLNPLTENDAFVSDIHQYVSESLAARDYVNPDLAVPVLATHWEQTQTSWGIPVAGKAADLAAKLEAGLSAEAKSWIKVGVEKDGRLRLDITKLGDGYYKEVQKIVGDNAFIPVQWVATKLASTAGKESPKGPEVVAQFKALVASKPPLKLSGDQIWSGEAGFVFRLPGEKAAVEKIVADFLKAKEQGAAAGATWEIDKTETFPMEDKLYYTFHLRQGVKWHDGNPLTVKDFLFTFNAMKDPGVDCQPSRNYYQDCEALEAPDASTLRFTWRKLFQGAFTFSAGTPLLPEHIYAYKDPNELNTHIRNKEAFGTGPYKFKEWLPKQRVVLERNEDYWGTKPNLKYVHFRIIQESKVRMQMLTDKKIDFGGLTPPQWENDAKKPPFNEPNGLLAVKQYDTYYNYIGWNARLPKLSDKRVRQALTMSINRDKILKELLYGLGTVVSGTFYSLGPYNDPNIKPWPFDPDAAKKLFAAAGWKDTDNDGFLDKNGEKMELKIRYSAGSETSKKILVAVQSDLKKAGVDCQLDPIEWSVFLTRIKKREFDGMMLGWSLGWDPDPYQLWHSSQTENEGSNHAFFKNKEADDIIERLRKTFDPDERIKLCHRFHAILHDEQPYTFMFNSMALIAHNANLKNLYLPVKPGEKRELYFPIANNDHDWARFWYMPKTAQRIDE